MRRLLTPVAKFWICKRGSAFAQEAMECLGGNGYVEEGGEGVMARIYREMPVNSIWEGAGNIMGLDLLRALRRGGKDASVADALAAELEPARGAHAAFDRARERLLQRIDAATDEADARRLAQDVALLVQAALLRQHAPDYVFDAFCASRLAGDWGQTFGTLAAGERRLRFDHRARIAAANWNPVTDLILHHYSSSPFSEKVRLVLGYKGLDWQSVTVPVMLPKPDVVALTGGYRRTPFLQIGADIYCDTALICRVIERLAPKPSIYPASAGGAAHIVSQWADSALFWVAIPYTMQPAGIAHIMQGAPPEVLKAFGADRAAMTAGMRRATPADAAAQLKTYLGWIEAAARRRAPLPVRRGGEHRRLLGRAVDLVHPPRAAGRDGAGAARQARRPGTSASPPSRRSGRRRSAAARRSRSPLPPPPRRQPPSKPSPASRRVTP